MSLETALKENTEVMKELIAALTALPVNAETPTKKEVKKAERVNPPEDTKPFTFDEAIAYAYFAKNTGGSKEGIEHRSREYARDDNIKRIEDIDALRMALVGIPQAKALAPLYVVKLASVCFNYWEELPTIALRREFAEKWITTPTQDRDIVRPDVVTDSQKPQAEQAKKPDTPKKQEHVEEQPNIAELRKTAQQHLLQLCKDGKREQAVELLKSFNADKLGGLQDADVSTFITRVEALLGG